MKGIIFYLAYSFLWLLTLLPLGILYGISNFLFLLGFHIVKYRKQTVLDNLRRSFPDKPEDEINFIVRRFYRQLMDYFIEWMYRIHMGNRELERRFKFINPEVLQEYYDQGRSIMLLFSHQGNWEWTTRIPSYSKHVTLAIYKPLENKYFDRLFLKLRGKFGVVGIPMESTLRTILTHHGAGQPVIVMTLADQRPQYRSMNHWTRFMNQDAPVITGPEKIARKFNMVTILLSIDKIKRGYYEAEFQVLNENPSAVPEYEITRQYLSILENKIREKPELYLWTHKRWKYRRSDASNPVDIG